MRDPIGSVETGVGGGEGSRSFRRRDQDQLQRELADKITTFTPLNDIRILLACGALPSEPVVQGLTPLHYACYANYIECVRLLLVRGSQVSAVDDVGYSALHLSAEHGSTELVELLIKHQARVSFVDPTDTDLFPRAYKCEEPLRLAIKNGHFHCARLLLENGANPDARYFLGSEISMLSPTDDKFLRLLLVFGANPNVYDRDGFTPLMRACRNKDGLEAASVLLEYGAYVNALALKRQDLRTPLHYSILSGNIKLVEKILSAGGRVNMPPDYEQASPLDMAVLRDDPAIVELLLEAGANPNAVHTYIGSPLHLAACSTLHNEHSIVSLLLQKGADPTLCPMFEEGVLKSPFVEYLRKERPSIDTVRLFLAHGARVVMDSTLNDPNGMLRSLLHIRDDLPLFHLLIHAAESFNPVAVQHLPLVPMRDRLVLRTLASTPFSLVHAARIAVRHALNPLSPHSLHSLPIPNHLKAYLLFQN